MELEATPPTGNAAEDVARRRQARRLLARMDRMEEFARSYEQFDELYPDLPQWELECQRRSFADTYRRLVGVRIEDRAKLRGELQAALM